MLPGVFQLLSPKTWEEAEMKPQADSVTAAEGDTPISAKQLATVTRLAQPSDQAHSFEKPPTSTPPFLFSLSPKAVSGTLSLVVQENKVPEIYDHSRIRDSFLLSPSSTR